MEETGAEEVPDGAAVEDALPTLAGTVTRIPPGRVKTLTPLVRAGGATLLDTPLPLEEPDLKPDTMEFGALE